MADPADFIPTKIRQLTPRATLADAGIEIGVGAAPGNSYTVPAALAATIARSYVKSRTTVAAPASPAEFDRYVVPTGGTGAWTGHDGQIAEWLKLPNNAGASTGGWYFMPALGVNFVEDEGVIIAFGAAGTVGVRRPLKTVVANYVVLASDGIIRFDTTTAAALLTCTINRNLGAAANTREFSIERASSDATMNPIQILDDTGALRGEIISPVTAGQVPFLTAYADGVSVTVKGVP